ncbi:Lateral organ boundaries domain family protein [Hibiscus syriacus]|uniref:Lateral organ boundaries domain family protein n=1 Tax=Hibiscus syriacus TaxID=106335 RepID=A0A6A3AEH2_HIBSY|nr:Lateral organ boundaries domain family protein [Hibiscus syriacus]
MAEKREGSSSWRLNESTCKAHGGWSYGMHMGVLGNLVVQPCALNDGWTSKSSTKLPHRASHSNVPICARKQVTLGVVANGPATTATGTASNVIVHGPASMVVVVYLPSLLMALQPLLAASLRCFPAATAGGVPYVIAHGPAATADALLLVVPYVIAHGPAMVAQAPVSCQKMGPTRKIHINLIRRLTLCVLDELDTNVAVKRISKASKQGIKEYASEVKIISRLRHKNCKPLLTWDVKFKIVHGLASALFYLHEEGDHCILHRDIKASNIMLDSGFNVKLGDFELTRLVDHAKGSQTTHLAWTMGYMAPKCISLVAWVWDLYGNRRFLDMADLKLSVGFDDKETECLLTVGLWCVHPDQNSRPSIRQVIGALNFEAPLPKLPSTRPTPTYDVPIGRAIQASELCCSIVSITLPS